MQVGRQPIAGPSPRTRDGPLKASVSRPPPAAETTRLYKADWAAFATWCEATGLAALPAAPATVTSFLGAAAAGLSAGALGRRAAAIGDQHRRRGLASPVADPLVKAVLRDARRSDRGARRASPPRPAQLVRMATACPGDLAGLRDRALLLLMAAGLGRLALVGLDVERLCFTPTGVELTLAGAPVCQVVVACGANPSACPVQALREWLRASDTRFGPVFRKIDRWGNVEHRRLGADAIRLVLARRSSRRDRKARA
jgi:site-specific recombinase XerD